MAPNQSHIWLFDSGYPLHDELAQKVEQILPHATIVHIHNRADLTAVASAEPAPSAAIIPVPLTWVDAYQLADELRQLAADCLPILLTQGKFTIPRFTSGHLLSIDHAQWGETLQEVVEKAHERQKTAVLARRQAEILSLLSSVSQQIFLPNQLEQVLAEILPRMGHILRLNRIMLFEQDNELAATPIFYQRYQWNQRTTPAVHSNHAHWGGNTFAEWGLDDWLHKLAGGKVVCGNSADFTPAQQDFLRQIMHTETVLMVPIFSGDAWWGFLAFDDDEQPRHWPTAEIDALCAFANVLGAAIENARLFAAERRQLRRSQILSELSSQQTDELASLYDISLALTGVLEPTAIMEKLNVHIGQRLQPDVIMGVLLDEELEEFVVIAAQEDGRPISNVPLFHRVSLVNGGLSGWVMRNQRALLIGDLQHDELPVPIRQITTQMPRTWLGMPLLANGRVIGSLSVQSYQPHAYTRDHMRFLEMVTTQAALAIESARLFQQEASRRREAELLNQLTAALNQSALDHQRILTTALEVVREFIPDLAIALVNMLDETGQFLTPQAILATEERFIITPVGQRIPIAQTQMARLAITEMRSVIQEDLHLVEPANGRARAVVEKGLRALMYVPVISKGKVIGLFNINMWDKPRRFRQAEIAFCELVASHVGITLENAQLYAREARRRQEAELLHTLTASLIHAHDLQQIAEIALSALRERLPRINSCYFSLLDPTGTYCQTLAGWGSDIIAQLGFSSERIYLANTHSTRRALEEKRTIFMPDLTQLPDVSERTQKMIDVGLRTVLYVPLLVQERPIGILQVHGLHQPIYFTKTEMSFVETVANHVALAAENTRLREAEHAQLHLAQTLRDVGALLTTSLSLDEVFERIFDLLARVVQYDSVTIQLHDEVNDLMYLAAGRGFADMKQTAEIVEMLGRDTITRMANRTYQIVDNTAVAAPSDWIAVDNFAPIRSVIRCALRIKDKLIGVLNVDSFTSHRYTNDMAETVVAFANQAVVAIENARLYDEINQRVEKLSIYNEVAAITTEAVTVDELIHNTTRLLATRLYQERFGFLLMDETRQYLITHESYHQKSAISPPMGRIAVDKPRGIVSLVARTGQPYLCLDALEDPFYVPYDPLVRCELTIPLKLDEQVIGVINVESTRPNAFNEEDAKFLFALGQQLATAIQRAQLYEASQFYATQLEEKVAWRTAELQQERDFNHAILDSAGEGILYTDKEGMIVYANPAMSQQTGYSTAEMIGLKPNLFKSGLTPTTVIADMWESLLAGKRWRGQFINRRKDGTLYDSGVIVTPLYDQHNELRGFVSVQSDISQLKDLDRLKSEFVTNVSHELRTPLTNIHTFVALLRRGKPEKMDHYYKTLERETERLTRLIQDLLDLSQIEMNNIKTELRNEDVTLLLDELEQTFAYKAQEKQIALGFVRPEGEQLPLAQMDRSQINQVLTNLLGNALAYTLAEGRVTVTAATGVYLGQEMLAIRVADTGLGMDEEDRQRIFDRFYRGRAATESRAPGTGLGLSISKEIMNRHHGGLEVESELGRGTTFTVWLPLA